MLTFPITKLTLGFRIVLPDLLAQATVREYSEKLYAPKLGRARGKVFTEKGDPYFLHVKAYHTYYFHISHLQPIKDALITAYLRRGFEEIQFEEKELERERPTKVEFLRHGFDMHVPTDKPELERFFYQNDVVETAAQKERLQTIFALQCGRGKCFSNDTPIKMLHGWKPIGEAKVGEWVMGPKGYAVQIDGVFPNHQVNMNKITFWDGRTIIACDDHQWQSFYTNVMPHYRWGVRDTKELKRILGLSHTTVYVPLADAVQYDDVETPLDPYLIGLFIGDGCLTRIGNKVGKKGAITFTKPDEFILDSIRRLLPGDGELIHVARHDYRVKYNSTGSKLRDGFQELGLGGCDAFTKFIPERFFEASIEQRWALIQGLFDTDGTTNKDGGQPSFTTVSKQLAKDVQKLVWSLGGIAMCYERYTHYTHNSEKKRGAKSYTIRVRYKKPSMFFRLPRKKKLTRDNGQYTDVLKLRVKSIEPIGKMDGTCISVNSKDCLYVAKDYIVTHNTKSSQKVMVKLGVRTVIIVRAGYVDKWVFDNCRDETGLRENPSRVLTVNGHDEMMDLIEDGKSGMLDKRKISTIIISTTTLQAWIKRYCDHPEDFIGIDIAQFYDYLRAGLVLYDEVHEHFNLVYNSGIAMNPPKLVEMSATLTPSASKEFIISRYGERFPVVNRLSVDYIPVVDVLGIYYRINNPQLLGTINRLKLYDQKQFEEQLYRHRLITEYFEMIYNILEMGYLKNYQEGQKALVFFSRVKSCVDFKKFLDKKFKESGRDLDVAKFNSGDSYDAFIRADVGVSTVGKAGTAIDIPGLVLAVVTDAIDDRQRNEQVCGRPRPVKPRWDLDPKVVFLHCSEIAKHRKYLDGRRKFLQDIVLSFRTVQGPYILGANSNGNVPTNNSGRISTGGSKHLPRNRKRTRQIGRKRKRRK